MSCTDACIYVGDYDGPEFWREEVRRARKPYKCDECRDPIAFGELYQYVSGKWDGEISAYRTCLTCAEVRAVFSCDGFALMTLWDDIREQMFPEWDDMKAIDCLAKLKTQAAIDKMRARYDEYRKDQEGVLTLRRREVTE